jgi:acyl-coenzyme A synthetase/AMP-(fatty) acid ligase
MLDPDGHFYYQKRKDRVVKTAFMRWGQAWMAYALARLIETRD